MNKHARILILYLSILTFSFPSYAQKEQATGSYVITVKTSGLKGSYLYLSTRKDGSFIRIDSLLVPDAGVVRFEGKLKYPEILYLLTDKQNRPVAFFAENSLIEVLPDFTDPSLTKVTGSSTHDELIAFNNLFTAINQEKQALYEDYSDAHRAGRQAEADSIGKLIGELGDREYLMNTNYIKANPSSHVSPYIIRSKMYYSMEANELKSLVDGLQGDARNSVYTRELYDHITILEKVAVGQKFQDISLPDPDGGQMAISQVAGKGYLLIDFWASWCGPCRRENPNVVALYKQYHPKGFDILGISFDQSAEGWKKAIKDDQLEWSHISDLKGWGSAAAKLYGVSSIPHTILLDPDGIIIAKNLRGEELEKKLEEIYKD